MAVNMKINLVWWFNVHVPKILGKPAADIFTMRREAAGSFETIYLFSKIFDVTCDNTILLTS